MSIQTDYHPFISLDEETLTRFLPEEILLPQDRLYAARGAILCLLL